MPDITPPSRYDMAWKAAISHAFHAFVDFFFPEVGAQVDWRRRPRFRDKELAAIGFGGAAGGLVVDLLVEVYQRGGSGRSMLIHIEVQAQRDPRLAARIFDYRNRIAKQHGPPVTSVVLLADDDPHWRPHAFHSAMPGSMLDFTFATAKLLDHADQVDELMASHNPFALLTLAHLRTQQAQHDPEALYAAKWQLTQLLYQHRWRKTRILVMFNVINWMMNLPEQYQQRYLRAVIKLEKERNMELLNPLFQSLLDKGREKGLKEGMQQGIAHGSKLGLERGLQQGIEKGLEQGLEQGRRAGALELLERQLVRRFGTLPKAVQHKLAKASMAQLQAWSDALPEAKTLQMLFE